MYGSDFALESTHLMLTKPHVSFLNQSAVIAGLVCRNHLSYPSNNIVSLIFLDEIMRSLINQGLKGWQGFKPWTLGINVDHYKRRKIA
jgi:hypothetical protein